MSRRAVIFDVDGVLVDSYDAHLASWCQLAAETSVTFTEADFAASFGRTSRDIIAAHWVSDICDPGELDLRKEALYREMVQQRFPAMDGAVELIDSLGDAGFALAAGSSGPPENVILCLGALQRRECFAAIVTGYDVRRGKPDPEVFALCAARLGVPAQLCAVIEDAPAGIEAARTAGMAAIALVSRGHRAEDFAEHAPDQIVHSLRELTPMGIAALIEKVATR